MLLMLLAQVKSRKITAHNCKTELFTENDNHNLFVSKGLSCNGIGLYENSRTFM